MLLQPRGCDELAFELRDALAEKYGLTDTGELTWHLGMRIVIEKNQYAHICQSAYTESIIRRFNMQDAKPAQTPMVDEYRISKDNSPKTINEIIKQEYMEVVSSLLYLGHMSRPDIAYACSQLGTVLGNPRQKHLDAAKRVIRYLIGTVDLGLYYKYGSWQPPGFNHEIDGGTVAGYTDADWAGDRDTRKSSTCYLTFMSSGLISYKMVKQKVNAMSSAESELIAMSAGARDIQYVRNTLESINISKQTTPTRLMCDSSAAIAISENSGMNDKTKHIALRYFSVRDLQKSGILKVDKIGTDFNPSDICTKALGSITFLRHLEVIVKSILELRAGNTDNDKDAVKKNDVLSAIAEIAASASAGVWNKVARRRQWAKDK